jgi:hypothetical protein
MRPPPSSPQPSWNLERTEPRTLLRSRGPGKKEDERGRFFLALALAYNDLKGLAYLSGLAKQEGTRSPGELSPEAGEQNGVQLQITRYLIGLLHELMNLIKANEAIVLSSKVVALAGRMPSEARDNWTAILDIALQRGDEPSDRLWKLLHRVRNNLAFHYDQPKNLAQGYERAFFGSGRLPQYDAAYYSLGTTMEFTRYFYADAAAQAGVVAWGENVQIANVAAEVSELGAKVNVALRYMVGDFLLSRTGRRPVIG